MDSAGKKNMKNTFLRPEDAWWPALPGHWSLLPNRAVFHERIERCADDEQMLSVTIERGVIQQADLLEGTWRKDSSNDDRSNYKVVHAEDIVYNKMRMWQGAIGFSPKRGIVSPAYVVLTTNIDINTKYYHYLFRTPTFARVSYKYSYGICDDMLSLRYEDFKTIYIPVPPKKEQDSIVAFIENKMAQIDDYRALQSRITGVAVSLSERQNSLIEELRRTLIYEAVFGGH